MLTRGIDGRQTRRHGGCPDIDHEEPHDRVVITEEIDAPDVNGLSESAFARRHPVVAYLFGDMVRGFYVIGCLGLDLFAPVQLRLWFPGMDVVVLPPVVAAIVVLAYGEWRLYWRLWPGSRGQRVVVDRRTWR